MYFVLKILKIFIYIIPLYMFRTPLCPSSGASQLQMQSLIELSLNLLHNMYILK